MLITPVKLILKLTYGHVNHQYPLAGHGTQGGSNRTVNAPEIPITNPVVFDRSQYEFNQVTICSMIFLNPLTLNCW